MLCGQRTRPNGFKEIAKVEQELQEAVEENLEEEQQVHSEVSFEDAMSQEEDQAEEAMSTIGGGKMMTWGTGYQKGLKLGPDSQQWAV